MTIETDIREWKEYVTAVRSFAPEGYEAALATAGVMYASQAFILSCFLNSVPAKECADKLLAKFKVENNG